MRDLIIKAMPTDFSVPNVAITAVAIVVTLLVIAAVTLLVVRLTAFAAARAPHPPRRPSHLTIVRNAQED